ncbi:MAG: hypothetical protein JNM28_13255 [Armatimonadetes bacterium]|nr:hypothetical protein [Armatimonadota bacterium]MBS1711488.1 hypothetical protein [Armatimonadota bacterium]MBX3107587.1 hypothetical protein [Fimbriimonadaceae bacterium]
MNMVLFLAAALPQPAPLPDSHSLLPTLKVGDAFAYEMKSQIRQGAVTGEFRSEYEMTVTSLEPTGTVTFKTVRTKSVFAMGGKESEVPDSTVVAKMRVNGAFLSVDPPAANPEQARVSRLMQFQVPDFKIAKGQGWSWKDPASSLNGNVGAEGKGECLGFYEHSGIECANLRISLVESEGSQPASAVFTVWLSLKDGMIVESAIAIQNAPIGQGSVGDMAVHVVRKKPAS